MNETLSILVEVRNGAASATELRTVASAADDVAGATARAGEAGSLMASRTTSFSKAQGDADSSGKKLNRTLQEQRSGVGALSSGMGGLVVAFGLYEGVKSVSKTLEENQKVQAQTVATLHTTAGAAGVSATQVYNFAKAQAALTGTSKAAIGETENLLLTFNKIHEGAGNVNDTFKRASLAALDMAQTFHIGPTAAAKALGIALQEPEKGLTRLSRLGIVLTKAQKEQVVAWQQSGEQLKAQNYLLGLVESRVKGSADAYGRSLPGLVKRGKLAMEEFGESIAKIVLPSLTAAASGLASIFDWFTTLPEETKKLILTLVLLAAGFATIAKFITVVKTAWLALQAASLANPWAIALMLLVTIAVLVVTHWNRVSEVLKGLFAWFGNLGPILLHAGQQIGEAILYPFKWALGRIENVASKLSKIPVLGTVLKVAFDVSPIGLAKSALSVVGLAEGGTTLTPGLVEVGERGPEIVNLPKGATVAPLPAGSMSGGWGSGDIVLKVDGKTLARLTRKQAIQSQAAGA